MHHNRRNSIVKKLTLFLATSLVIQCTLFAAFILLGGTLERLDKNAMDILNERTINRKNYLENEMVRRWSNLDRTQTAIAQQVESFLLEHEMPTTDLTAKNPKTAELLGKLTPMLTNLLRTNSVTGTFVIFHGDDKAALPAENEMLVKSGLYFRDLDPMTTPEDFSDIMVERGPSDLIRNLNYPMDVNWKPTLLTDIEDDSYYMPFVAALTTRNVSASELGYWSATFTLSGDNVPVITYSQPLLDTSGMPYGVLGVEIALDYLHKFIPSGEMGANNAGGYLLVTTDGTDDSVYSAQSLSGAIARRAISTEQSFKTDSAPVYADVYAVNSGDSACSLYSSVQPLNLYSNRSPYQNEGWVLVGVIEGEGLFSFSASVATGIVTLMLFTLVAGIAIAIFAGRLLTRPILALSKTVRTLDPTLPVALPHVNIDEIDDLSLSIEQLSSDVSAASSRLTRIIELSDISLAAFELSLNKDSLYCTRNFCALLNQPEPEVPFDVLTFHQIWENLKPYVDSHKPDAQITLFKLPLSPGGYRWVRLQTSETGAAILGVLTDITAEMMEKKRLQYERDYDLLTNLLNRRSFLERITQMEQHPEKLNISAMLMLDLDNLKYLNDTYGHDCGDQYIRCAADVLRQFTVFGGVAARISGDEFYLFLSGYASREKLTEIIQHLQESIAASGIRLPSGQSHRLRASMGIAWYPEDSAQISELIRYADFAMYEAKTASKGGSRNFNLNTYKRDAFLLYSHEELNHILDESAVDYAFQPIVSCADGSLLAYEALMRPRSKILSSPQDVLRVARAQSKLARIEHITWYRSMESFAALENTPDRCLIFINSVSSHALEPDDMAQFTLRYKSYLNRMVIELTESEEQSADATDRKQAACRRHHIRLAMDDFGTGYSNDSVLLTLRPDFVKADMSIIRGIDRDKTRQTMLHNLVSLCRELNVKVIAEGVETADEMRTVITIGADYIQGYYTGKPAFVPTPLSSAITEEIRRANI